MSRFDEVIRAFKFDRKNRNDPELYESILNQPHKLKSPRKFGAFK
jgi:hypothetical protein